MCNNILEIALDMKNFVSLLNKDLTRYVSEMVEQQIVPTFRLSPFQALKPFCSFLGGFLEAFWGFLEAFWGFLGIY